VLNKQGSDGAQITVLMHVDDLFITSKSIDNHMRFEKCMRDMYTQMKIIARKMVDSVVVTFDFIVHGQVSTTMDNYERSILSEYGMWPLRLAPAASTFFGTREAQKATNEEVALSYQKGEAQMPSSSGVPHHKGT
jgi:hypothetical protein